MLRIESITIRNFLSFGNAPQEFKIDEEELVLVLGVNNDAPRTENNEACRNGVGKSTILQALVYGLYGSSIGNNVKVSNLVNDINEKNMHVTIKFLKDDTRFIVERGRSPSIFNFYAETDEKDTTTRGENNSTQEELNKVLGISRTLFEHIVCMNTNVSSFLEVKSKQREIIEELVGINKLTEQAIALKAEMDKVKKEIDIENAKINTIKSSNLNIERNINTLKARSDAFESELEGNIERLSSDINNVSIQELESVLELAKEEEKIKEHNRFVQSKINELDNAIRQQKSFNETQLLKAQKLQLELQTLNSVDISTEISNHELFEKNKEILSNNMKVKSSIDEQMRSISNNKSMIDTLTNKIKMNTDIIEKSKNELEHFDKNTCPVCLSELHDNEHTKNLKLSLEMKISNAESENIEYQNKINTLQDEISNVFDVNIKKLELEMQDELITDLPKTFYKTLVEAKLHEQKVSNLEKQLNDKEKNPFDSIVDALVLECSTLEVLDSNGCEYSVLDITSIIKDTEYKINKLEELKNTKNPYTEQLELMKNTLVPVDEEKMVQLDEYLKHQDALYKLLTHKDSYIRKNIIEQSISYLNERLTFYIKKFGLKFNVVFLSDLSVDIYLNSKSYDFQQLSRGERNRLIVALNMAFREQYESIYQSINILMIDELLDNGLDPNGIISIWKTLVDFAMFNEKNVYIISHREELLTKAEKLLVVQYENSFSTANFCNRDDFVL